MNLFDQLNAAFATTFVMPPKRSRKGHNPAPTNKPWLSKQVEADARYRKLLMGKTLPTSAITDHMGITRMGGLTSLYKLEERGKVKRMGTVPRNANVLRGRGQILWTWVDDAG